MTQLRYSTGDSVGICRLVYRAVFKGPRGPGPQASHQHVAFHQIVQTVHILFLANDRCLRLRDYDLVVAHC